jgi:hypothetical protein
MARKKEPKYKKIDLITKVVEMTTSGISQPEVKRWLMEEGECKIDYVYQVLNDAKPIILETLKGIASDRLEETIIKMEQMQQEAIDLKDRKLAVEIQKEINKISGLHSQKIDVTSNGESINNITTIKLIEIKKESDDDKIEEE